MISDFRYRNELQDIQKMVFPCIIVFYLWKWEVHVYILKNSFVHDVECITVWTLRIHFVCVICMYMCVLLYSRCFLKIIFKSALWTYCIQGNIHPNIIFSPPLAVVVSGLIDMSESLVSNYRSFLRRGETLCNW